MSELDKFGDDLVKIIGRPTKLRPFVCEGSPLTCTAFIVGLNAATELQLDFWEHWRPGYGFDKAAWFEDYKRERARQPLKAGKKSRRPVSRTRTVIELIIRAASPARCLETNIYSTATASSAELTREMRSTEVLDFLLERIRPRIILAHGADAVRYFEKRSTVSEVLAAPHFALGFSNKRAIELGKHLSFSASVQAAV